VKLLRIPMAIERVIRAKPFCYSRKVLLTIKHWNKKIAGEIKRVKSLQPNAFWVNDPRKEGRKVQYFRIMR
jgi:hypothetical protein